MAHEPELVFTPFSICRSDWTLWPCPGFSEVDSYSQLNLSQCYLLTELMSVHMRYSCKSLSAEICLYTTYPCQTVPGYMSRQPTCSTSLSLLHSFSLHIIASLPAASSIILLNACPCETNY
ncbi:hypothetical protein BsWGS_23077 [Bradybaena similaris]